MINGAYLPQVSGYSGLNGGFFVMGRTPITMSDANYAPTATQLGNGMLDFTGALTATRTITLPLVDGVRLIVRNNTSGSQSLTFIASSGTGITVANAKVATLFCDGVNWSRLTADTTWTS